jgi:hypothetical protein
MRHCGPHLHVTTTTRAPAGPPRPDGPPFPHVRIEGCHSCKRYLIDVDLILRALQAPPEVVAEVTSLTRLANTEWQSKRSSWRRGLDKRQKELAGLEASARRLQYFLPSMVTGLLATPEYIAASLTHCPVDTAGTVARKLARQDVLCDSTKQFTFLLTEQAARSPTADAAAADDEVVPGVGEIAPKTHGPSRPGSTPLSNRGLRACG